MEILWCTQSAQCWLLKRLQGCQGRLRSSTDWQTKSTGDWGSWGLCVSVVVCVYACAWEEPCYTRLLSLRDLSDCWITDPKPGKRRREAAASTVSSSSFYKMPQWREKFELRENNQGEHELDNKREGEPTQTICTHLLVQPVLTCILIHPPNHLSLIDPSFLNVFLMSFISLYSGFYKHTHMHAHTATHIALINLRNPVGISISWRLTSQGRSLFQSTWQMFLVISL